MFGAAGVQEITCTYGITENRKCPFGLGTTVYLNTVLENLENRYHYSSRLVRAL